MDILNTPKDRTLRNGNLYARAYGLRGCVNVIDCECDFSSFLNYISFNPFRGKVIILRKC